MGAAEPRQRTERLLISPHLQTAESIVRVAHAWAQVGNSIDPAAIVEAIPLDLRTPDRITEATLHKMASGISVVLAIRLAEAEQIVFEHRFDPSVFVDDNGALRYDPAGLDRKLAQMRSQAATV